MRYLFRVCSQGSRLLPDPFSFPNERLCDPPHLSFLPQVSLCDPCPHPALPFLTFLYSSGPSDLGAALAPLIEAPPQRPGRVTPWWTPVVPQARISWGQSPACPTISAGSSNRLNCEDHRSRTCKGLQGQRSRYLPEQLLSLVQTLHSSVSADRAWKTV